MEWSKDNLPWSWDKCKDYLTKEILDGNIPSTMKPKDVYALHPQFKAHKYERFRDNLRSLRNRLEVWGARSAEDQQQLEQDLLSHPINTVGRWEGSAAQRLLKEDHDNNRITEQITLEQLWRSRPEYQLFEKRKFGNHVRAVKRSSRTKPYWIARKQSKATENEAAKARSLLLKIENQKKKTLAAKD